MTTPVTLALKALLPKKLPPTLVSRVGNLYTVLSRYPQDGVGQKVHQMRWGYKGIYDSYWLITKSRLKIGGTHGRAWGQLYWKGKKAGLPTKIPGGLKYTWDSGPSHAPPAPKSQPTTTA